MSDIEKVMDLIKENDVQYVDLRFTDPRGKWQHTAQHARHTTEEPNRIAGHAGPS